MLLGCHSIPSHPFPYSSFLHIFCGRTRTSSSSGLYHIDNTVSSFGSKSIHNASIFILRKDYHCYRSQSTMIWWPIDHFLDSSSGIGREAAILFAELGANVTITGRSTAAIKVYQQIYHPVQCCINTLENERAVHRQRSKAWSYSRGCYSDFFTCKLQHGPSTLPKKKYIILGSYRNWRSSGENNRRHGEGVWRHRHPGEETLHFIWLIAVTGHQCRPVRVCNGLQWLVCGDVRDEDTQIVS